MSEDSDVVDDPYLGAPSTKSPSGPNRFFKSFMGKSSDKFPDSREAGMEQNLITKIERMNFKDQMDMFYTAYSKVRPEDMTVLCLPASTRPASIFLPSPTTSA